MTFDRARVAAMCLFLAAAGASAQNANHAPPAVKIETNGTVQVPAHSVPMSSFLTPEGQAYVTEHLLNMQRPEMLAQKDGIPVLLAPYLERYETIAYSRDRAADYASRARQRLAGLPDSAARDVLAAMTEFVVLRSA